MPRGGAGACNAASNDAVIARRENRVCTNAICCRLQCSHAASSRSNLTTAAANKAASSSTATTCDNPGRPWAPAGVVTRGNPARNASTTLNFTPAP
jgi:hypothetical protein